VTEAHAELRRAGLRTTRPRVAVLEEVQAHPHADVDTIARGARNRLGSVSKQAVYDVLRTLTAVGLVRRLEPAGSPARFEAQTGDNHHHRVCRVCAAIFDVPCLAGRTPCLRAEEDAGFVTEEAEVILWGVCSGCRPCPRAKERPSTASEGDAS